MKKPARTIIIPLGERPINLTQVLKLAGCVQSGGEAKARIAGGDVRVNGEVELRKRRQMKAGDTVELADSPTIVLTQAAEGGA
jgi:ribosome-associated protein